MKNLYLILFVLLMFIIKIHAQFGVSSIPYSPYPYTGGTSLPIDTSASSRLYWDDRYSANIPIGFNFSYFGQVYNQIVIGTNSVISFDTMLANQACSPTYYSENFPTTNYPKSSILNAFKDYDPGLIYDADINYYSIGSAPNRKFIINYYKVPRYATFTMLFTSQIVLNEIDSSIILNIDTSINSSYPARSGCQDELYNIGFNIPSQNGYWTATNVSWKITTHYTPPPPPIDTGIINGFTYYDINGNCVFDSLIDYKAPFQTIRADNGINVSMSDMEGNYTMYIDSGYHTITADTNSNFQSNCPLSHSINFLAYPDTFSGINFADSTLPCISPNIYIMSPGLIPCDTASAIYVSIHNMNPILQYNLQLIVELNDSLHINQCSVPYVSLGFNRYLLDIADTMLPYTYEEIYLLCNVGCDSLGSIYSYSAVLSGDNSCSTNFQDSSFNSSLLVASYDPNEMLVKVANTNQPFHIENPIDSNSILEYMVTFQNSGSAPARNIRIEDVLNFDHIAHTIEITGSSYPCFFTLTGNVLNFAFQNINLPFGDVSDPTTHGFVTFKIKQIPGHIPSNYINNSASIYFDYNLPIYTNVSNAYIPYSCDKNRHITVQSPICNNEMNGSISVNPDPGYGDYYYYWYNDSTENSISNLGAGTYFVDVYDLLCYYTDTVELINPNPVIVNVTSSTDSICFGDTLILQASGANTYDWSVGTSHSNVIQVIPSGDQTYTVIGYDANLCASTLKSITVYAKNCDEGSGINDITNNHVKIYPTLTNDLIHIESKNENINKIRITDLSGIVYFESNQFVKDISVVNFPKGIYLVHLQIEQKDFYQKISKY